ncbi:MAG: acylphosphatase [Actinobacteria bacterium]|nr:MAG: acylphosphatase [Actinomycetota bacterium]
MPAEDLVRARVVVSGLVQGVFFREETRRRARSLGIAGWVANRPEGTVEAVFEGPREQVESMVGWCSRGPSGARVDDVQLAWEDPRGDEGFAVR